MNHPFFDVPNPCAIGHRGAAGELPENTLSSFERALARGASILESDLRLSADGVPVLFHDATLERTSDGSGPLKALPYQDLRRLDAGYHFRPDPPDGSVRPDSGPRAMPRTPPMRGRGIRIPSFEEALLTFSGARFNIELKDRDPALAEAAIGLIARLGCADRVLLTAEATDHMAALRAEVARVDSGVALGACLGDVLGFLQSMKQGKPPPRVVIAGRPLGPMALQVPPHTPQGPLVDATFVQHAHHHGIPVHVWTVNAPNEIEALLHLGVDGVISDFPARVVEAIGRR